MIIAPYLCSYPFPPWLKSKSKKSFVGRQYNPVIKSGASGLKLQWFKSDYFLSDLEHLFNPLGQ